jgi:hypothetical protein
MTISTILKITGLTIISAGLFYAYSKEENPETPKIEVQKVISIHNNLQRSNNLIEFEPITIEEPVKLDKKVDYEVQAPVVEIEPIEVIAFVKPIADEVVVIEELITIQSCRCLPNLQRYSEIISLDSIIDLPIQVEQEITNPYIFETNIFPNPTQNESKLTIEIDNQDVFVIEVYNMSGQLIKQLHNGELDAGRQSFNIEFYNQPTGLYIIQVASSNQTENLKLQKVD